jgi:predicted ATPase
MITSLSLAHFKSFREATLPLGPLSLLIGANASGKSNAIEGIRFLSWMAEGRRLDDLMSAVQAADQRVRGTIGDLVYRAAGQEGEAFTRRFGFRCTIDIMGQYGLPVAYEFLIEIEVTDEGMRVVGERISTQGSSVPLYVLDQPAGRFSHEVSVRYNNFSRGGIKPQIPCSDQQAIFTQLETPARFSTKTAQREIPKVVGSYRQLLEDILFLDPNPRAMRGYSFIVEKQLKDDGANLSSVLFNLCQEQEGKERVLGFIRALPEQDIRGIKFIETPRSEVMVQLIESFADHDTPRDASLLSDGTLRVLAIAAALLSAKPGALVIVEEIDNGVHPSRAGMLLENIQRIATERRVRVLVTTHNPALLDALPVPSLKDVVCCYRDPAEGDSRLLRLSQLSTYPELLAQGPLGQLMTRGIIDRYVKDSRTDDDRRKEALEWLDALEHTGD